jgi:hypothetical protein
MTEPVFPEPPEQKAYVAGWSDPVEARRRRIEALAAIVDGLYPWIYTPDLDDEALYNSALNAARQSLLWNLAWAGALNGAHVFDECGEHTDTIVRLKTDGPDPFVVTERGGSELWDFIMMAPGYVGLPGSKMYGEDAIVELARNWLEQTHS